MLTDLSTIFSDATLYFSALCFIDRLLAFSWAGFVAKHWRSADLGQNPPFSRCIGS